MRHFSYLFLLLVFSGCASDCVECFGGIVSDAKITFVARGQHYSIDDREGEALPRTLWARYDSDSTLTIYGEGTVDFILRALPFSSSTQGGVPDTGTFLLNEKASPILFMISATDSLLRGSASVFLDTGIIGINDYWTTDSTHIGTLRITEVDTINNLFSGTFHLLAVDTLNGADTIRVDSGVIYKVRL